MRTSRNANPRTVYVEIGIWYEPTTDAIKISSRELGDWHIRVQEDPSKPNGHPTLHRRLAAVLRAADLPAPDKVPAKAALESVK